MVRRRTTYLPKMKPSALESEQREVEIAAGAVVHTGDVGCMRKYKLRIDDREDDRIVDHGLTEVGVGLGLGITRCGERLSEKFRFLRAKPFVSNRAKNYRQKP